MWTDIRDTLIDRVSARNSFADVGGLYEVVKEKVSVAARAGASALTLIDVIPFENPQWGKFHERMKGLGIENVHCVSGDIQTLDVGPYDVVHSSGVLYHLPSPFLYLQKLRTLARKYVILTSTIAPKTMGSMSLPDGAAYFVPGLKGAEREMFDHYYRGLGIPMLPPEHPWLSHRLDNFTPNWWMPTAPTIKAMCECTGFKVLEYAVWTEYPAATYLLQP